jgi:hypothetical protein
MIYVIIFLILILLIAIYKAFINVKEVSECCNAEIGYSRIIKSVFKTENNGFYFCKNCLNHCKTKLIVKFKNKWYERNR